MKLTKEQDNLGALVLLGVVFSWASKVKRRTQPEVPDSFDKKPSFGGLAYSSLVSPEFAQATIDLAGELGLDPNDLMTLFRIERGKSKDGKRLGSGVYHKYTDKDGVVQTGDFSYGLFGILPATAFWLGSSPEEIYKMSDLEQLDLVKKYIKKKGLHKGGKNDITNLPKFGEQQPGELTQFDQLYSSVWGGLSMVKAGLNDVLVDAEKEPKKYAANVQADFNKDGKITKKDVLTIARQFRRAGQ